VCGTEHARGRGKQGKILREILQDEKKQSRAQKCYGFDPVEKQMVGAAQTGGKRTEL
jgi:hypothetical protein